MGNRRLQRLPSVLTAGLLVFAAGCAGSADRNARGTASTTAPASGHEPAGTAASTASNATTGERAQSTSDEKAHGRWQPDVVAWAPYEHLTGVDAHAIVVADTYRNRIVTRREVEVSNPSAIAASPSGRRVVVADMSEKGFLLWDVAAHSTARLNGHGQRVVSVALSKDGKLAASVARNGTALLWDLSTKRQIGKVEISNGADGAELSAVAFSRSGRRVALGTLGGNVCVWNVDDGSWKIIARHDTEPEIKPSQILPAVKGLAFTPDDGLVVSGGQDQYVLLTDPSGRLESASAGPYEYIGVQAIAVSPRGDLVAIAHADGVDVVRYGEERRKHTPGVELSMRAHIDIRGGAQSLAFSPDGQRLAASIIGEGVTIWEVNTGESFPLDPR